VVSQKRRRTVAPYRDRTGRPRSACGRTWRGVETELLPDGGMAVRDTQNRGGDVLRIPADAWEHFTASLK
jgi:hypothetical protein